MSLQVEQKIKKFETKSRWNLDKLRCGFINEIEDLEKHVAPNISFLF